MTLTFYRYYKSDPNKILIENIYRRKQNDSRPSDNNIFKMQKLATLTIF